MQWKQKGLVEGTDWGQKKDYKAEWLGGLGGTRGMVRVVHEI